MAEKSPSLATQAYHTIKENILNLTYPPGMVLTEAMLTKELEMSRSPVRTAIQMLQVEGLIVSDYYKSMTVKEITDKDINEIYQLRELLEGAAFRQIFTSAMRLSISAIAILLFIPIFNYSYLIPALSKSRRL